MRKLSSIILVIAIIIGFFAFGGTITTEDGIPKISFNGSWESIGTTIGDAAGDLIDGFIGGIKNSDTVTSILPSSSNTSVIAPQIPEDSSFQIHFIDVGQADSTLIICDGNAMLIDGGNNDDGDLVVNYLTSVGVTELDLVVGTHAHEDHIGGLDDVLNAFEADEVWYPDYRHGTYTETSFLNAVTKQNLTVTQPDPGTTYTLGSAICQVVGPITLDEDEPNNTSLVIRIVYGETSFLFTGDAELEEETQILDAGYDISCDVLKVGHHGSSSSTNYRWLKAAAPTYAVISVGAGNEYGHPTEAVLSRLSDAEATVYRTDIQGHIVCISDGKTITFCN